MIINPKGRQGKQACLQGCISNWGQIGRLQVAATIAKSTCVDYTPKLKCTLFADQRFLPICLTHRGKAIIMFVKVVIRE